jgi:hypothetical protein
MNRNEIELKHVQVMCNFTVRVADMMPPLTAPPNIVLQADVEIKMYISRKWNLMFRKMAPKWPTNNDIYHHVTGYLLGR